MKDFFKPEDFSRENVDAFNWQEKSAAQANEKLNKLIESSPVVYSTSSQRCWTKDLSSLDKLKGKILFVEEIVKEPCVHILDPHDFNPSYTRGTCKKCGAEMIADWRVK